MRRTVKIMAGHLSASCQRCRPHCTCTRWRICLPWKVTIESIFSVCMSLWRHENSRTAPAKTSNTISNVSYFSAGVTMYTELGVDRTVAGFPSVRPSVTRAHAPRHRSSQKTSPYVWSYVRMSATNQSSELWMFIHSFSHSQIISTLDWRQRNIYFIL